MASCTVIESLMQGYVDDELKASEKVILEEHVVDCAGCKRALREHQSCTALLFEVYGDQKLANDLVPSVMAHLPSRDEMDFPTVDVEGVNWRAKHPTRTRERLNRLIPLAAAALLLVLAGVIREYWPSQVAPRETVGVVLQIDGAAERVAADDDFRNAATVKTGVRSGDRFETTAGSRLLIGLAGQSRVMLNSNSRVLLDDARNIRVEQGEAYFDVAKGDRLFKVLTPQGDVTVFGTAFDVRVTPDETLVVLERGKVQVGHNQNEQAFATLEPGEQVYIRRNQPSLVPEPANVQLAVAWTEGVDADEAAELAFAKLDGLNKLPREVDTYKLWVAPSDGVPIKEILLTWEHDDLPGGHCGYQVKLFGQDGSFLFEGYVPGSAFNDPSVSTFTIPNPGTGERTAKFRQLHVRLIPDFKEGAIETDFKRVTLNPREKK